jgi:hypothetical protein
MESVAQKYFTAMRIRPALAMDISRQVPLAINPSQATNEVTYLPQNSSEEEKRFKFHRVLDETCSQSGVYESLVQSHLPYFFEGNNITVVTYGDGATGKSYLIEGTESEPGIVPRLLTDLCTFAFNPGQDETHQLSVSIYHIYQEKIVDLLSAESVAAPVKLMVNSIEELNELRRKANQTLFGIGKHQMNVKSCRSHIFYEFSLGTTLNVLGTKRERKLTCVDLASLQRSIAGPMPKELTSLNVGLSELGRVIATLAKRGSPSYRSSCLTKVLQSTFTTAATRVIIIGTASNRFSLHLADTLNFVGLVEELNKISTTQRAPILPDKGTTIMKRV